MLLISKTLSARALALGIAPGDARWPSQTMSAPTLDGTKELYAGQCAACCQAQQALAGSHAAQAFDAIKEYILRNVDSFNVEVLTLSLAAKEFGKSPNHLSARFPVQTGENFKDFLTGAKLEKARKELEQHGAVTYMVANRLGYYNVSHFIRIFKDRYGMTPKQYQEKHMQENRHPGK